MSAGSIVPYFSLKRYRIFNSQTSRLRLVVRRLQDEWCPSPGWSGTVFQASFRCRRGKRWGIPCFRAGCIPLFWWELGLSIRGRRLPERVCRKRPNGRCAVWLALVHWSHAGHIAFEWIRSALLGGHLCQKLRYQCRRKVKRVRYRFGILCPIGLLLLFSFVLWATAIPIRRRYNRRSCSVSVWWFRCSILRPHGGILFRLRACHKCRDGFAVRRWWWRRYLFRCVVFVGKWGVVLGSFAL